jgi:HupE / UreJ protein
MPQRFDFLKRAALALLLGLCALFDLQAHVIAAQRGTLNIIQNSQQSSFPVGAYMVLSVPASAFRFADTDGDGRLSIPELHQHQRAITSHIQAHVQVTHGLCEQAKVFTLQDLVLNLSPPENAGAHEAVNSTGIPSNQLLILGRFVIPETQLHRLDALRWRMSLFGQMPSEQRLSAIITHKDAFSQRQYSRALVFDPEHPEHPLAISLNEAFVQSAWQGVQHIVWGFDHLLFLLTVLAGMCRQKSPSLSSPGQVKIHRRDLFFVLTSFTLGHAVTMFMSLQGGWNLSARWVESAIAATIVMFGAYELWLHKYIKTRNEQALRFGLVFVCALIHGLGLADSFLALGILPSNLLENLLGFNLGIECAQLVICLGLLWSASFLKRLTTPNKWEAVASMLENVVAYMALFLGSVWLLQRLIF